MDQQYMYPNNLRERRVRKTKRVSFWIPDEICRYTDTIHTITKVDTIATVVDTISTCYDSATTTTEFVKSEDDENDDNGSFLLEIAQTSGTSCSTHQRQFQTLQLTSHDTKIRQCTHDRPILRMNDAPGTEIFPSCTCGTDPTRCCCCCYCCYYYCCNCCEAVLDGYQKQARNRRFQIQDFKSKQPPLNILTEHSTSCDIQPIPNTPQTIVQPNPNPDLLQSTRKTSYRWNKPRKHWIHIDVRYLLIFLSIISVFTDIAAFNTQQLADPLNVSSLSTLPLPSQLLQSWSIGNTSIKKFKYSITDNGRTQKSHSGLNEPILATLVHTKFRQLQERNNEEIIMEMREFKNRARLLVKLATVESKVNTNIDDEDDDPALNDDDPALNDDESYVKGESHTNKVDKGHWTVSVKQGTVIPKDKQNTGVTDMGRTSGWSTFDENETHLASPNKTTSVVESLKELVELSTRNSVAERLSDKCNQSVAHFFEYATDSKDECEGLFNAYDNTCLPESKDNSNSDHNALTTLHLLAATKQQKKPLLQQHPKNVQNSLGKQHLPSKNDIQTKPSSYQHSKDKSTEPKRTKRHSKPEAPESTYTGWRGWWSNIRFNHSFHDRRVLTSENLNDFRMTKFFEKKSNQHDSDLDRSSENSIAILDTHSCCSSILEEYRDLCSTYEEYNSEADEKSSTDTRFFLFIIVMALCGIVKSLVRHFEIFWLPEAAGCILVGVLCGVLSIFFPHRDISFDGNWFLRILVPPIIFEAALSIDKKSFNRHALPIVLFAAIGTLFATILTALIVHYGTGFLAPTYCVGIPFIEALTFGSLISSIDPIAVLSVLRSLGMTDTDTIYVLIFGESLLNDGVAIVLFDALVGFLKENMIIDRAAMTKAAFDFFFIAFGSLVVGVVSGWIGTAYFWAFYGCQTPLVEMLMFFCWALLPYYICDGLNLSGIVGTVAVGFCMDMYIVGERKRSHVSDSLDSSDEGDEDDEDDGSNVFNISRQNHFTSNGHGHNGNGGISSRSGALQGGPLSPIPPSRSRQWRSSSRWMRPIRNVRGHLSQEARTHIRFVVEIVSTGMETAIFAYLGFFLFSNRYHWNTYHVVIAILSCCLSRAVMIPILSTVSNCLTRIQLRNSDGVDNRPSYRALTRLDSTAPIPTRIDDFYHDNKDSRASHKAVIIDRKMQIALWFAGLRGAMSFALVEYIPMYDSNTGDGTRLKPELKAMTSASIMFTMFILGGSTYWMMQALAITPDQSISFPTSSSSIRKNRAHDLVANGTLLIHGNNSEDGQDDDNLEMTALMTTIADHRNNIT